VLPEPCSHELSMCWMVDIKGVEVMRCNKPKFMTKGQGVLLVGQLASVVGLFTFCDYVCLEMY
jgi:hypothetical protein